MPVVIKSFMGIFFFSLIVFLGIGMIGYQTDASRAISYKQDTIEALQNSNFAPSVINACILAGAEQEYEVSIDVSHEDGSNRVYTKDALASDGADAQAVCVTVLYKSRLPFLGAEMTNRLRGFAK